MSGTPTGAVIRRGRMRGDHFTQVSNDLARDRRLSRRARGLFVELASHREGWQTSIAKLTDTGPEGTHAIRVAIEELEKHGYLVRAQTRDPKTGRVTGTEYWLTDCPEEYRPSSEPSSENHTTDVAEDSPSSEPSSDSPTTAEPTTGHPTAGEPISGGRTHKKTNSQNTNEKKTNLKASDSFADAQESAPGGQQPSLLDDEHPAPAPRKKTGSRKTKERSTEEQLRFTQATEVAQWWWDECDNAGVPKIGKSAGSTGFPGLVQMIESALADDYSQKEIAYALRKNPTRRFPPLFLFEQALMAVRGIASAPAGPGQQRMATSDLRVSQVQSMMDGYEKAAAEGRLDEWFATPEPMSTPNLPAAPATTHRALEGGF